MGWYNATSDDIGRKCGVCRELIKDGDRVMFANVEEMPSGVKHAFCEVPKLDSKQQDEAAKKARIRRRLASTGLYGLTLLVGALGSSIAESRFDHRYDFQWGPNFKWAYLWDEDTGALVRRFSIGEVKQLSAKANVAYVVFCERNLNAPEC